MIGYEADSQIPEAHYVGGNTGHQLEYTIDLIDDTLIISFPKLDGKEVTVQFVGTFSTNDTPRQSLVAQRQIA